MVLIDADARCYRTGRTGQLPSPQIEILDLPFRRRVLQRLMFTRGILWFLFPREKNSLDIGVLIECIIETNAKCGIRRGMGK